MCRPIDAWRSMLLLASALSLALFSYQSAVVTKMSYRVLGLTHRLVETGQIVVTVGKRRVLLDRRLVRFHGRVITTEILEQDTQIEEQHCVGSCRIERVPVHFLRLVQLLVLVQQAAPVDPGTDMRRIACDRTSIGITSSPPICLFELYPARKPPLIRLPFDEHWPTLVQPPHAYHDSTA